MQFGEKQKALRSPRAILANMIFMPFAGKVQVRHKEEMLGKMLMLEGIISISSGDNPRMLEQKLMSFVPPSERKTSDD